MLCSTRDSAVSQAEDGQIDSRPRQCYIVVDVVATGRPVTDVDRVVTA